MKGFPSIWRRIAIPDFTTYNRLTDRIATSPDVFLTDLLEVSPQTMETARVEFEMLRGELASRVTNTRLPFPEHFRLRDEASFVLYVWTRNQRPRTVVETGVANGTSTFFLLKALEANGHGKLISLDVTPGVGALLAEEERRSWDLRMLSLRSARTDLKSVLDEVGPVDLFFHDSDHRYLWQHLELRSAFRYMSGAGVICADDVDDSYAFVDFCADLRLTPALLIAARGVLGFVSVGDG